MLRSGWQYSRDFRRLRSPSGSRGGLFGLRPVENPPTASADNYSAVLILAAQVWPRAASVVRNVAPPCCACNLFMPGTLPNFYIPGFSLTPPKSPPRPRTFTESSTPIALVCLSTLTAPDQPPTPMSKPHHDALGCSPKTKLSSLTPLLWHSPRRTIFESPKQNPQLPPRPPRQRLPPNLPIASAPAAHTRALPGFNAPAHSR